MRKDLDLIRRHVTLLEVVEERQPIGIYPAREAVGTSLHRIRYALRILEQEGLVRPFQKGAITTAMVKRFHEKLRVLLEEMKRIVESLKESP